MIAAPAAFEPYLSRWDLKPDGRPIRTRTGRLLPVVHAGLPAMLKLLMVPEERRGARLLAWWNGQGAARVLEQEEGALLMERAQDQGRLAIMARGGRDDEASRVLCAVAAQLHAERPTPLPQLEPLPRWFRALTPAASRYGGVFQAALDVAGGLLDAPEEVVPLHGDLHHGNVLHFGERGWLAIDPKGLGGERAFEFANILCNPDVQVATSPGRLPRQLHVVSRAAGLNSERLTRWVIAWCGLSAAWHLEDGDHESASLPLAVASEALAALP